MYLKELEIFGFKSFPEKTNLTFESGITVVVGPNGCGKSNIFDGIKWALGEQSPKSLRGSKMEDVIFNGTENHPPLNYTEVSLTFLNEDRYLPIDYREVSISRRLYRSGESQYFINKNAVRLKDVQELFMGTGAGQSTYSFIEQGRIEVLLSYKPEDKRLIFDEASGIVRYKERKKETLRKLEETRENLLRLEDILSEVRRQTRYLERQVAKAKRYKQVQEQLIEVERKIATLQFGGLEGRIDKLLDELNVFKENEQEKNNQLEKVNNGWEELNDQEKSLRDKLEERATIVASLGVQIESSDSHIVICRQRIKEIEERNAGFELTRNDLGERLRLQEERSLKEKERMSGIEESLVSFNEQIEKIEAEKEQLKEEVEEARKKTSQEKTKILDLETRKAKFHNTLIEIQTKFSSLINRKKRLLLDRAKLDTLLLENKENFKKAEDEFLKLEDNLRTLREKKEGLAHREKELISNIENVRLNLVNKEKEFLELSASYEFLKDFSIKYETFSVRKKVTVIFGEEPKDINKLVASLQDVKFDKEENVYKAQIEVKVISFKEKQLEERIEIVRRQIEDLKANLENLEQEKVGLIHNLSVESAQIEEERGRLQEKLQEKDNLMREVVRLKEESELLEQETKTTLDDIEDYQKRQKEIEEELSVYEENLEAANDSLIKCQEIITGGMERIKEIDIETTRGLAEVQSLHKEKDTLSSKVGFFQDEINNIRSSLGRIDKEKEDNVLRLKSFDGQIEELESRIKEDRDKIDAYTKEKITLEQEELFLNKEIEKAKELMQSLEKESQEQRASAYNKKLEIQSLEYEKEKIKDYLRQVYNIEFELKAQEEITESIDVFLQEKEKLQKKAKSLGEVNLVAIEEFEELKKREDFMETQKQDIISSEESLKKAIQKINRTSKEIFMEVFTKIEGEFKKNFKFLFNGGRANLILLDKDNLLESGVEIEVQPPGKKLQNVSLLSGGEKALTAIALVFAIFRVRPSPLCVLDEIDAPLDEANVDRFNHLLKEFSSTSQFIIVTHNKKTMSNANVLYGVTMQEKGISKLVSVKFAEEAPV